MHMKLANKWDNVRHRFWHETCLDETENGYLRCQEELCGKFVTSVTKLCSWGF